MLDTAEAPTSPLARPAPAEHDPYYRRYIDLVPDGDIVLLLKNQLPDTLMLLTGLPADRETHRYAEGKWSLREVVGHMIDVERIFQFRALAMARQDGVELPGMDQDAWAMRNGAHQRPMADLIEEWVAVRRSAVHLFATFDVETGARTGRASGRSFTVRCFPWIMAGHEIWHRNVIRERYLNASRS